MNLYFNSFDEELAQKLQTAANSIVPPDRDEVWAKISADIEESNRKAGIPVFRKFAAVAAVLILLLTAVFTVGDYVLADFRFFQTIKSAFCNVVNISGVTQTRDETPAVGDQKNENKDEQDGENALCSLGEARQTLNYNIAVPNYVPASYTLNGVFIKDKNSNLSPVELHYIDSVTGNELIVDECPISQVTSFSFNFRSNDAKTLNVEINEYEATLIYFDNTDLRILLWQTPERYYIVTANLDEEEIIEVAKSLDM